jgi:hypothetical protein
LIVEPRQEPKRALYTACSGHGAEIPPSVASFRQN